jgi:hypothetical protein
VSRPPRQADAGRTAIPISRSARAEQVAPLPPLVGRVEGVLVHRPGLLVRAPKRRRACRDADHAGRRDHGPARDGHADGR